MFDNMMGKLQEMQQKMEATKKRLETVTVEGEAPGGKVKVIATASRQIVSVSIADDLLAADKEELEDLLIIALNKALSNAENTWESEMKGVTSGMIPPGLGF